MSLSLNTIRVAQSAGPCLLESQPDKPDRSNLFRCPLRAWCCSWTVLSYIFRYFFSCQNLILIKIRPRVQAPWSLRHSGIIPEAALHHGGTSILATLILPIIPELPHLEISISHWSNSSRPSLDSVIRWQWPQITPDLCLHLQQRQQITSNFRLRLRQRQHGFPDLRLQLRNSIFPRVHNVSLYLGSYEPRRIFCIRFQ